MDACGSNGHRSLGGGPAKPVIVAEMPDCYMPIGSNGITLFTNASVPDGGVLRYQWYVTDIENMAMIRAIDYADGNTYRAAPWQSGYVKCVED